MTTDTITIEQLEALAAQYEADDNAERTRLHRLICAFARIIAKRDPQKFPKRALEQSDEDGHYDNSYPPKIEYKDYNGPRLIKIKAHSTNDIATSGGFYHPYRTVTTDPGLYIARDGTLYGCNQTGTGEFGQFAAHPGDCNVMCSLEWDTLDLSDVPIERLQEAERKLRALAFPLASAAA